jgi:hypothetical protein
MSQIELLLESYQGETEVVANQIVEGERPEDVNDMICGDCECN